MRYSIIRNAASFLGLSNDWQRLLSETNSDSLHMSWPFVETWMEIYGPSYEILVFAILDNEQTVGIAPFMIKKARSKFGIYFRELRFLCDDDELSFDYLDFLILDEHKQQILKFLRNALLGVKFDVINLRNTRNRSPFGEDSNYTSEKINSSVYTDLPSSWDTFFESRDRKFRYNIRARLKNLRKDHDVKYVICEQDISLEDGFNELITLNLMRWGDEGEAFKSGNYIRFHREIMKKMLNEGNLFLRFLSVNDEIVSANYSILYKKTLYVLQMGRNPNFDKYGVGNLLIARIIEEAIEKKIARIDFLATKSEYKKRWADNSFDLFQILSSKGKAAKLLNIENSLKSIYHKLRS